MSAFDPLQTLAKRDSLDPMGGLQAPSNTADALTAAPGEGKPHGAVFSR